MGWQIKVNGGTAQEFEALGIIEAVREVGHAVNDRCTLTFADDWLGELPAEEDDIWAVA